MKTYKISIIYRQNNEDFAQVIHANSYHSALKLYSFLKKCRNIQFVGYPIV